MKYKNIFYKRDPSDSMLMEGITCTTSSCRKLDFWISNLLYSVYINSATCCLIFGMRCGNRSV